MFQNLKARMKEYSRTIAELISLYTLESDLIDLYVEGITDKLIIDNYNEYKNLEVNTIEINNLDFTGVDFEDLDFESNKDKLILLSRILTANQIVSKVHCLIDKDFDGILKPLEQNKYLLRTDFCCIESYFFSRKVIQKFIDIGIRRFPFDSDLILEEVGSVLRCLFIMELIKLHFNLNFSLLKIENNLKVIRSSGKVGFNFEDYLSKFILANSLTSKKNEIFEFKEKIEKNLDADCRNTMNGHYFIEVLFLYINKIKSAPSFNLLSFERAFLLSLQPDHFEEYKLFKIISEMSV